MPRRILLNSGKFEDVIGKISCLIWVNSQRSQINNAVSGPINTPPSWVRSMILSSRLIDLPTEPLEPMGVSYIPYQPSNRSSRVRNSGT